MSGGDIETGKCEICGVEGPLERTYFKYPIKCECHAPTHFTMVRHCSNCTAVEPIETKITIKTEVLKKLINTRDALKEKINTEYGKAVLNGYYGKNVDLCDLENNHILNIKPLSSEDKHILDGLIDNPTNLDFCKGDVSLLTKSYNPIRDMAEKMTVAMAMEVLGEALREDTTPGSYYYSWQSNLACTIIDNSDVEHDQANVIAKRFLNKLMGE